MTTNDDTAGEPVTRRPAGPTGTAEGPRYERAGDGTRPAGPTEPAEGRRSPDLSPGARSAQGDEDGPASDPDAPGTSVFDTGSPDAVEPNEPA